MDKATVESVMALAFELARIREQHGAQSGMYLSEVRALRAEVERLAAQAAPTEPGGDVEPVAWGIFAKNGNIRFWACDKSSADSQAAKTGGDVVGIVPASTLAAAQALNAELVARVEGLEKDAEPDEFTRGIDAAAKMLDKMADDYSNEHAVQDPDTGVYEFGRGGKEDYYNTLRELADDVRSIVYAPGERENTAQTLKAAKDAAFEQAANLLECEYAEDAKQKRRLDQIAQHIRDLKKRSS